MRRTTFLVALFTIAAMALMFYYSSVKVIVITGERTGAKQMNTDTASKNGRPLALNEEENAYLVITLPDGVTAEHISIDNNYMDKIVEIGIRGANEAYYQRESPYGRCGEIVEALSYTQDDTVYLYFKLAEVYEVDYLYETGKLSIRFVSPNILYDRIVLLDAGAAYGNGKSYDSFTSEVVSMAREGLEAEGIKVYDVSVPDDYDATEKMTAINRLKGDMYVAVEIGESGKSGMEAYYNDMFFMPFVGNVTLADAILRVAAVSTDAKANGLFPCGEEDMLLQNSQIPSTRFCLGHADSAPDMQRLAEEGHRQTLAESIVSGIMVCYALKEQYGIK